MLLGAAFGVVAGVPLVQRDDEQLDGRGREGQVDRDSAAQVAEVVVVRQPWRVADGRQVDAFALGQLDESSGQLARPLDHGGDDRPELLRGYPDRVLPALT